MAQFHDIEWTSEKAARLWAYYAREADNQRCYFSFHSGRRVLAYIQKYVGLSGKKVLDFGCGPGYFLSHMALALGGDGLFGLDFSKETIDVALKRVKGIIPAENLKAVDGLPSSYAPGSFDAVIAVEVIEHLNDEELAGMFREAQRLLRPGGHLVLTTPNGEDLEANKVACPECGCVFHRWQHVRRWDGVSLARQVEPFGFRTFRVEAVQFEPWHKKVIALLKRFLGRQVLNPQLVYIGKKGQ